MDQIPQKLTTLITGFTTSQFVVMAIIFFLYVIFGMFMDGSIVILLLTPILMPIIRVVGIDPVLFGVVTSIIVTMGILTPPVGIAMYIVNGILNVPMSEYLKESIPFFIVVILVGAVLLLIPNIILFLPNLLYGVA
jgi:TRAP-type C4-dicarboxylate transport system permease large subunit